MKKFFRSAEAIVAFWICCIVATAIPIALNAAGFNPVTVTDPAGVNQANVDGSGNLKVNCTTGCSGSPTFPYSGTTSGQTATTASFLGAGGIYNSSAPTLTSGQYAPLQLNASGALNVSGSFSATPPLTGANGTGTAGAAGQATVSSCNYTTSPATMTSGNVGPESCTANGYQIMDALLWGTTTLGNATAAGTAATGNIISVQGNASGVPVPVSGSVTVTQATASNLNVTDNCSAANCSTNLANIAGTASVAPAGNLAYVRSYAANTVGGGCDGYTTGGTAIAKVTINGIIPNSETQIVALAASKVIQVCHLAFSGTLTSAGTVGLYYGTGTNCGTGGVLLYGVDMPAAFASIIDGNGEDSIVATVSANALCIDAPALGAYYTLTYAQY